MRKRGILVLTLLVLMLFATAGYAATVSHPANQIIAGTFDTGDFIVNGSLTANDNITADYFIGNGGLLTGISGGGESLWRNISGNAVYTAGNVGIGTTSPSEKLEVNGSILVSSELGFVTVDASSAYLVLDRSTNTASDAYVWYKTDGAYKWLSGIGISGGTSGSEDYRLVYRDGESWATRFIVTTAGNVGIGTASPSEKLHVSGNALIEGNLNVTGASYFGTQSFTNIDASGNLVVGKNLTVSGGDLFVNDATGNVGIGTTTPSQKLDVNGNVNVSGTVYASNISSNSPLQLQTKGTTRIFVNDTTGNIGIGTATPSQKLDVNGSTKIVKTLYVGNALVKNTTMLNLVALLHYDENAGTIAYDASPYGNNGSITGATWVTGKSGSALSFDGVNDYASVADANSLDISGSYSYVVWFKTNTTANRVAMEKGTNKLFILQPAGDALQYGHAPSATATSPPIWDNQFHHLAIVYDSSQANIKLYIDGSLFHNTTIIAPVPNSNALYIGSRAGSQYFWNGTMDEFAIYDNALTPEEVTALYLGTNPQSTFQVGASLDNSYDYFQIDTLNADTAGPPPVAHCSATTVGRAMVSTRYTATAEYRLWICTQTGAATFAWKYATLT